MLSEYDFSKAIRNPYVMEQTEQVTISIDAKTASYFKRLAEQSGVDYRTLLNLYLTDCAEQKRTLTFVRSVSRSMRKISGKPIRKRPHNHE